MASRERNRRRPSAGRGTDGYVAIVALALLLAALVWAWALPLWVPAIYVVASIVCFVVYAVDKRAAVSHGQRTPESTLLLLGLVGGWPGAVLAQQMLRHKTTKRSFRARFWITVVVNVVVLGAGGYLARTLVTGV
jgi:uncharacterized membrane protein YsdA (DUF1294 family)